MKKGILECAGVALASYVETDHEYGLRWELPAYLCRYILAQYAGELIPWIAQVRSYDGRGPIKLMPQGRSVGLTLAWEADCERMQQHQPVLTELVNRMLQEDGKILKPLNKTFPEIAGASSESIKALTMVIERGDYHGSCDACWRFVEALPLAPDRQPR